MARMRFLVLALLGTIAVSARAGSAWASPNDPPSSAPVITAVQELAMAIDAGSHQQAVREISRDNQTDGSVLMVNTDAGISQGIQMVTYEKSHVIGHLTDVLTGGKVYFKGDSFSLVNIFSFLTPLAAGHAAGKWVSASSSDKSFPVIADDLTLSSVLHDMQIAGVLSSSAKAMSLTKPTHLYGFDVIGITAKSSANGVVKTVTLYVRTGSLPLPVAEYQTMSEGSERASSIAQFVKWNLAVNPKKPTPSIALASLSTG